jgi:hypothetical protein
VKSGVGSSLFISSLSNVRPDNAFDRSLRAS